MLEFDTVEADDAFVGSDPDIAVVILSDGIDRILGESVFGGKVVRDVRIGGFYGQELGRNCKKKDDRDRAEEAEQNIFISHRIIVNQVLK